MEQAKGKGGKPRAANRRVVASANSIYMGIAVWKTSGDEFAGRT